MAPTNDHIAWFDNNITWFLGLPADSLTVDVPNCPDWTVEHVLTHLAFGLGLGYPYGLRAAPDATEAEVWSQVPWPQQVPTGTDAVEVFSEHMTSCLTTFRAIDPETPCWTYAGPGIAGFWFRRAAIETTLHRMDVAEALDLTEPLAKNRVADAITEAVEFALPLAAQISGAADDAVAISIAGSSQTWVMGSGQPTANIDGDGLDVLNALWGRNIDRVEVSGVSSVAESWLSVIKTAFAGR